MVLIKFNINDSNIKISFFKPDISLIYLFLNFLVTLFFGKKKFSSSNTRISKKMLIYK